VKGANDTLDRLTETSSVQGSGWGVLAYVEKLWSLVDWVDVHRGFAAARGRGAGSTTLRQSTGCLR
jgi:hypothetical protein